MSGFSEELELPSQGLKQTFKDLFAGAVGGVAQVLLGQPFGKSSVNLLWYSLCQSSS